MKQDDAGYGFDAAVFSSVWERVSGERQPETNGPCCSVLSDTDRLRGYMEDKAAQVCALRALAMHVRGGECARLQRMCADETRHLRMLAAAYFILTGERFIPPAPPRRHKGGPSVAEALRESFISMAESAEEHARAAEIVRRKDLADLFSELSSDEARNARALADMIGRRL
ncbi:MAG: ferritin-like domain-containing protein, partial [Oscillospiraceae bacterium]|nr:ferritin-like domain-containing protein [Oscillospiraceae bacterium]